MARKEKPKNFAAILQRLTTVVETLEKGGIALEEAVKLYTEGTRLAHEGKQVLNQAEQQVQVLMQGKLQEVSPQELGK